MPFAYTPPASGSVAFEDITGDPTDNTALNAALAAASGGEGALALTDDLNVDAAGTVEVTDGTNTFRIPLG